MLQKHGLVPKMGIGEWNGSDQRGERHDERKRYPGHAASGNRIPGGDRGGDLESCRHRQVTSFLIRVPGMVSAGAMTCVAHSTGAIELIASGPAIRTAAIAALTSCMLSRKPT